MSKINPDYTPQSSLNNALTEYARFLTIVYQLRQECPWDAEQTHDSIKMMTLEEAYEAVDSINEKNFQELESELGDLLLHITLHSVIAQEEKHFEPADVIRHISEKLIRRHPHVFADINVENAKDVEYNWEQLKKNEGRKSVFDGIPKALPALQRAEKLISKAKKTGLAYDAAELNLPALKFFEAINPLEVIKSAGTNTEQQKFLGTLLLKITETAAEIGLSTEEALLLAVKEKEKALRSVEAKG